MIAIISYKYPESSQLFFAGYYDLSNDEILDTITYDDYVSGNNIYNKLTDIAQYRIESKFKTPGNVICSVKIVNEQYEDVIRKCESTHVVEKFDNMLDILRGFVKTLIEEK